MIAISEPGVLHTAPDQPAEHKHLFGDEHTPFTQALVQVAIEHVAPIYPELQTQLLGAVQIPNMHPEQTSRRHE